MPSRSTPLHNYPAIRSSDAEFTRDRLCAAFGATNFESTTGKNKFAARVNHLQIGGLGLSYCDYAGDVSIGFGEASFVRQIFNIDGVGRYAAGTGIGEIARGAWTPILPAEAPLNVDFKGGYRHLVLRIEFDALLRNLGRCWGRRSAGNWYLTKPAHGSRR